MKSYLPDNNSLLSEYCLFSEVNYIVSDIDGTLTKGSSPICEQIRKKTIHLRKKRVITTVATGRPYRGAYNVIQQLEIVDGTPLVLYNGGVLLEHNTGHIIRECSIPFEEVQTLVSLAGKCGAGIYVYTCEGDMSDIQLFFKSGELCEKVWYAGNIERRTDINGNYVKPMRLRDIKDKKVASILIERRELTELIGSQIIKYLESNPTVAYTDSGSGFIEIRAAQNKKSVLIEELKKRDSEKNGKILAIGDNDNDIDLFKMADISVAVANSSSTARKTADYLCRRDCAEGYLDMLMVIETAKRYWK